MPPRTAATLLREVYGLGRTSVRHSSSHSTEQSVARSNHDSRRVPLTTTFRLTVAATLLLILSVIAAAELFVPDDRLIATRMVRLLVALPIPAMLVGLLALLAIPSVARRENQRPPLEAGRHARQFAVACSMFTVIAIGPYALCMAGFRPTPIALVAMSILPFPLLGVLLLSQSRASRSREADGSPRCANCRHPIRGSAFAPCPECGWTGRRTD